MLANYADNLVFKQRLLGISDVHQGVAPALEIGVAILGSLAFAAWVPVVRGLSQAQTELAPAVRVWWPGLRVERLPRPAELGRQVVAAGDDRLTLATS
jgi:hypothetical protein